ncbi:hypothetical protein BDR07DRAFT_1394544 [Suillus spraguei]|nr:hypothetical protein BDR07DRAFT_1394544 [Suillus spraguei]
MSQFNAVHIGRSISSPILIFESYYLTYSFILHIHSTSLHQWHSRCSHSSLLAGSRILNSLPYILPTGPASPALRPCLPFPSSLKIFHPTPPAFLHTPVIPLPKNLSAGVQGVDAFPKGGRL